MAQRSLWKWTWSIYPAAAKDPLAALATGMEIIGKTCPLWITRSLPSCPNKSGEPSSKRALMEMFYTIYELQKQHRPGVTVWQSDMWWFQIFTQPSLIKDILYSQHIQNHDSQLLMMIWDNDSWRLTMALFRIISLEIAYSAMIYVEALWSCLGTWSTHSTGKAKQGRL